MKYAKCFVPCFLFLLFATGSFAQSRDSLLRLYNNQTIYRNGNNFQKGTEKLSFGNLRDEFSFSPVGMDIYTMAKKNRKTATVFRMLSLAATVVTLSPAKNNRTVAHIAWPGQILFAIAGIIYQGRSNKQLDKALWQRNKDLLFGQ